MSTTAFPFPEVFTTYSDLKGKIALVTGMGHSAPAQSPLWGNGAATPRLLSLKGINVFDYELVVDGGITESMGTGLGALL